MKQCVLMETAAIISSQGSNSEIRTYASQQFRLGKFWMSQSSCERNQLSISGLRKELTEEYASGKFPVTMPSEKKYRIKTRQVAWISD